MRKFLFTLHKLTEEAFNIIFCKFTSIITKCILYYNNITFGKGTKSSGIPILHLSFNAECRIGNNLTIGNWTRLNASGFKGKCKIEVRNGGRLIIGDNVGMTAATIMCFNQITIGNHVLLGVGTHIYDTDFHNINPEKRNNGDPHDSVRTRPIAIGDNVFIGAFSIILKGVTIGRNSVVGAGSVVTKDIPENEVWAGNPAKFIKKI